MNRKNAWLVRVCGFTAVDLPLLKVALSDTVIVVLRIVCGLMAVYLPVLVYQSYRLGLTPVVVSSVGLWVNSVLLGVGLWRPATKKTSAPAGLLAWTAVAVGNLLAGSPLLAGIDLLLGLTWITYLVDNRDPGEIEEGTKEK